MSAEIFRGTHGVVRKARINGTTVAIKECPLSEEARNEVAILSELQGHRNIIKLLASQESETCVQFAMEFIPTTLLDVLEEDKELSENDLRMIFFQLLEVVSHMHAKGIVHKDIKLENLLIHKGRIRLIDFGFSRRYTKGARSLCDHKGSMHYAAPEIWTGAQYEGPSVDVWAMGVTLFLLATGFFPFGGQTAREVFGEIEHPLWIPDRLRALPSLLSLIQGMLEVDMQKRLTIEQIYLHPWVAKASFKSNLRKTRSAEPSAPKRVTPPLTHAVTMGSFEITTMPVPPRSRGRSTRLQSSDQQVAKKMSIASRLRRMFKIAS